MSKKKQRNQVEIKQFVIKYSRRRISMFRKIKEYSFRYICLSALLFVITITLFLFANIAKNAYLSLHKTQIIITKPIGDGLSESAFLNKVIDLNFADYGDESRVVIKKILGRHGSRSIVVSGKEGLIWFDTSSKFDYFYKRFDGKSCIASSKEVFCDPVILKIISDFKRDDKIKLAFNNKFFTNSDSRYGENAGLFTAIKGTCYILFIFIVTCFPISLISAIYMEEFATKNKLNTILETNINNLSAVPSIVYGLLGLSVFIGIFKMSRSSALVGGLTLSMLALPLMITLIRQSLRLVPRGLRDATISMGATRLQLVFTILLKAALPGILTSVILAVVRVIGETAPLLLIGMVAFIGSVPSEITSPATAIPVQIYLWSSTPELSFHEKASLAILILIFALLIINLIAGFIRSRIRNKYL